MTTTTTPTTNDGDKTMKFKRLEKYICSQCYKANPDHEMIDQICAGCYRSNIPVTNNGEKTMKLTISQEWALQYLFSCEDEPNERLFHVDSLRSKGSISLGTLRSLVGKGLMRTVSESFFFLTSKGYVIGERIYINSF